MTEPAQRSLRLPSGFLISLHQALSQGRTAAETAVLLRQIGYESGDHFHALLEERLSPAAGESLRALTPARFWSGVSSLFETLGWGELRWAQLHPAIAALDSTNWVEAEGRREAHPACHLTTGLLAKLLARAADAEVAVLETECRSRGDERCRFLFGSPAALEALYEGMREGMLYTTALERLV